MLNQLLPVYFIELRYPDKLTLGVHQAVAQVFIFTAHSLEHILRTGYDWIRQTKNGR